MSDFTEWLTKQIAQRSLRDIADEVGVRHSTVKSWQTGYSVPSWHNCREIAKAFGVPREYVRALAGYVDADELLDSAPDAEAIELSAIWTQLDEPNRESLLRVAQALRVTQRRPAATSR